MLKAKLDKREWLASDGYLLADVNGFNLAYAMPLSQPHLANDEVTPNIMRWLRAIYRRTRTKPPNLPPPNPSKQLADRCERILQ